MKMLDQQLQQSVNVLDQRVKYQRDALSVQAEQQRKQLLMQLEQNIKAQEMALTQQYSEHLMSLQLQNSSQKAALEQQAMQLSITYEQRKAEEDLYRQQYEMHKQQLQAAEKMQEEHQRILEPIAAVGNAMEAITDGAANVAGVTGSTAQAIEAASSEGILSAGYTSAAAAASGFSQVVGTSSIIPSASASYLPLTQSAPITSVTQLAPQTALPVSAAPASYLSGVTQPAYPYSTRSFSPLPVREPVAYGDLPPNFSYKSYGDLPPTQATAASLSPSQYYHSLPPVIR